ncbi:DNA polymerase III subunit chi [Pseudomonas entomophila]|uniref:DNA polymerase III subunit chi n=1 Tax=Pseudomonas entomophila TaxID=312306 RepID=UPI0015E2A646|nr:DNA polymerase III subunit chi [Pseudomonas entomophila]MBA1191996.1 DNA polymerase III subunit chi [Pseudomonas entomophila]
MDKPAHLPRSTHLLDDLESIRQLLGDHDLQPPLLTETVEHAVPAPLAVVDESAVTDLVPVSAPPAADTAQARRQDILLHLDADLRAAARQIMQDVINDFTPHIETEIKRRLDARLERLLKRSE